MEDLKKRIEDGTFTDEDIDFLLDFFREEDSNGLDDGCEAEILGD